MNDFAKEINGWCVKKEMFFLMMMTEVGQRCITYDEKECIIDDWAILQTKKYFYIIECIKVKYKPKSHFVVYFYDQQVLLNTNCACCMKCLYINCTEKCHILQLGQYLPCMVIYAGGGQLLV